MKNLLFIGALIFGTVSCTSNLEEKEGALSKLEKDIEKSKAEQERKMDIAYESMASDMCGCFNDATEDLTDEGRKVIEEAGADGVDMQGAMMEYAQNSPENAMHDGQILSSLGEADVMTCIKELEEKYSNIYTGDSEAQVQAKLIMVMKDMDDCKLTYAFVKAGVSM